MEETERSTISNDLRQGDILRLVDEGNAFGFKLAIIINADCDMQSRKHDGVVSILPIYSFHQYLEKFWLPSYLNGRLNEAIAYLRTAVTMEERHLSDLISWFRSDPASVVIQGAEKIFSHYNLSVAKSKVASEALHRLHSCVLAESENEISCISRFAPDESEKAKKFYKTQMLEAKKQMGDDHFFITEIKGEDQIGYVVRMRRIYSLSVDSCFASLSALQSSRVIGPAAYRICKLTPHYKFKVAQIFAYQYSRIGLPDEVTALSDLAIENLVHHILSKGTQ